MSLTEEEASLYNLLSLIENRRCNTGTLTANDWFHCHRILERLEKKMKD